MNAPQVQNSFGTLEGQGIKDSHMISFADQYHFRFATDKDFHVYDNLIELNIELWI